MAVMKDEFTAKCTVSLAANLPAKSHTPVDIEIDPDVGAKKEHDVPSDREWILVDLWVDSSQTPDGYVQLVKNGEAVEKQTPPINTLLVSNPSRPRIGTVKYESGSKLSMKYINLEAVGTGGATVTFYAKFIVKPKGAIGIGLLEKLSL